MTKTEKAFENIDGKGENGEKKKMLECILLFLRCFLLFQIQISSFDNNLDQSRILSFDNDSNMDDLALYPTVLTFNNPKEEAF